MPPSCGLLLRLCEIFTLASKLRGRAFDFFIPGEVELFLVLKTGLFGCLRPVREGKEATGGGNAFRVKLNFGPIKHL